MTKKPATSVQANDYGELLAIMRDMELVFYKCLGSYQGEYLAILIDTPEEYGDHTVPRLFVYLGSYGSCSGCDWFESVAESDYSGNEVVYRIDYKEANEYVSQMKPTYILPAREYPTKELLTMFKKDRYGYLDFDSEVADEVSKAIKKALLRQRKDSRADV